MCFVLQIYYFAFITSPLLKYNLLFSRGCSKYCGIAQQCKSEDEEEFAEGETEGCRIIGNRRKKRNTQGTVAC